MDATHAYSLCFLELSLPPIIFSLFHYLFHSIYIITWFLLDKYLVSGLTDTLTEAGKEQLTLSHLFQRLQHIVRHVVIDHSGRHQHFIKIPIRCPDGLVDGFGALAATEMMGLYDNSTLLKCSAKTNNSEIMQKNKQF